MLACSAILNRYVYGSPPPAPIGGGPPLPHTGVTPIGGCTPPPGARVTPFGGDGGGPFQARTFGTIGLRTGNYVDQIQLDGRRFGGDGGGDRGSISLEPDEFITRVDIRSGVYIDNVKFTTSSGRVFGGGGDGGGLQSLVNIQLLAIGGRAGDYVDNLRFIYLETGSASSQNHEGID